MEQEEERFQGLILIRPNYKHEAEARLPVLLELCGWTVNKELSGEFSLFLDQMLTVEEAVSAGSLTSGWGAVRLVGKIFGQSAQK